MNSAHTKADVNNTVRRHTKLRRAVKIVGPWRVSVSLVFGVIATVLVAWWFQTGYFRYDFPDIPYNESEHYGGETIGESVFQWDMYAASPAATTMTLYVYTLEKAKSLKGLCIPGPEDTIPIPGFARQPAIELAEVVARGDDHRSDGMQRGSVVAVGYPMRAFRSWSYADTSRDQQNNLVRARRGSFRITNPFNSIPIDLAYAPIWRGLFGNTAIYGLLTYGLVSVPASVIGLLRRLTNRCHPCGHSLDGLTADRCPECNWRIKRRRGDTPSDPAGAGPPPAVHNGAGTGEESVGS